MTVLQRFFLLMLEGGGDKSLVTPHPGKHNNYILVHQDGWENTELICQVIEVFRIFSE